MLKPFAGLLIFSCLSLSGLAQEFNQYKTLQSRWSIPADFTGRSSQKYYNDLATIDATESRFNKETKKEFFLESNFGIGDFLTSGRVLFNDEASAYLGEILDVLLKDDQPLRQKLRIYVVKSAAVNAFATNNGIIFVTMGLLSRLENEAQLAWVLSHEIIHFREQHVINSYVKVKEIDRSVGMYGKLSLDEKDYARSSFNKEQETDSDIEGLKLFLKTDYTKSEALKVFDILAQAHLPAYDKPFQFSYFETDHYKFPDKIKIDSVQQRSVLKEYDDAKSSHPNLKKRKETIQDLLKDKPAAFSDKAHVVSNVTFEKIKTIASFEVLRASLLSGDYVNAFYQAYLLHDKYPQSEWVQSAMGKALYGLAIWGTSDVSGEFEGDIQRYAYLVINQKPMERMVLALRYLYPLHLKYQKNEELKLMVRDLMIEIALNDEEAEKRFSRSGKAAEKKFTSENMNYLQTAFLDFEDPAAFYTFFDEVVLHVRTVQKEIAQQERKRKRHKKEEPKTKIDKVLVIQPVYQKVDKRKRKSIRYEASEDVLVALDDKIKKAAAKLDLQVAVLNTNTLSTQDVAQFNDHNIIQDWLREKMQHESPEGISPIHNEIQEVMQKHGTNHLVWMGGMSLTERNKDFLAYALLTIVSPAFALPAAYTAFVPKKHTFFFSFTFDTKQERLLANDVRLMKLKDNNALMQSNVYYTLFKLKNQ